MGGRPMKNIWCSDFYLERIMSLTSTVPRAQEDGVPWAQRVFFTFLSRQPQSVYAICCIDSVAAKQLVARLAVRTACSFGHSNPPYVPLLRARAAVSFTIFGLLSCLLATRTYHHGRQPNQPHQQQYFGARQTRLCIAIGVLRDDFKRI